MDKRETAAWNLQRGAERAYDAPDDGPVPPATDWAHKAARGILYDLCDRRGIKHELADIDKDVRAEMIDSLAEIIRVAAEQK